MLVSHCIVYVLNHGDRFFNTALAWHVQMKIVYEIF